jgi:cytochrome c oxidase subunit III
MSAAQHSGTPAYFIPAPSKWPLVGGISMLLFMFGAAGIVNGMWYAPYSMALGFAILIYTLFGWFGIVAKESEGKLYSDQVDVSFRWSMAWFIFSEVMFFAAFFGALYYARSITMPWLGDLDHKQTLWPDFSAAWPNGGPAGVIDKFQTMGPWPIPTINTALLLTSGFTLTIAHHALLKDQRSKVLLWLGLTVLLGFVFLGFQGYEYYHAYTDLNLRLDSGIFGSTFFMLTGFHGFHVTLGAIMLLVIWCRYAKGHFSSKHHFGFEGAAWYWHFVDVVWLGLYVVVSWL